MNLRASAQRNITQPSKVVIMKTTPAEEIADGKALELAGHRIYLSSEPYKGKLVSTGLRERCRLRKLACLPGRNFLILLSLSLRVWLAQ